MKTPFKIVCVLALMVAIQPFAGAAEDAREKVNFPEMMKQHQLSNMRDHLAALNEILALLAKSELDKAADIAEYRLGMTSMVSHNASHMAPYMPKGMQAIGSEMHHAASRFALAAQEGDLPRALDSLSKVTQKCVACHSTYRVQ
jgi:soluble cytochrome b562